MSNCPKNCFSLFINDESSELIPQKIRYDGQMNNGMLALNIHTIYKNDKKSTNNNATLKILKNTLQIIDNVEFKIDNKTVNIDSQIIEKEKEEQIKLINQNVLYEKNKDFELNLGQIPQGKTCELSINMILLSKNVGSKTYKTFIPIPNQFLERPSPDYFSFMIHCNKQMKVSNISIDSENANFTFNPDDKTFNINSIPLKPITLFTELENDIKNMVQCIMNDEYFLISVLPRYIRNLQQNDFIFVIDCSGSMSGEPIAKVRECLGFYLHSLPQNCKFNIILFGGSYKCLFDKKLVDNNAENLHIAEEAAKNIDADLGGTELFAPLVEAYKQSQESLRNGRFTQIFILTDGEIDDEDSVFQLVEENRSNCTVNTIGVGNNVSERLINGKFDFVSNSTDISEKVLKTVSSALNPEMKNISVKILDDDNNILLDIKLDSKCTIQDGDLIHFIIKRKDDEQNLINQVQLVGFVNDKEVTSIVGDIHRYFSENVSKSIIQRANQIECVEPKTLIDITSSQEYNGKWKCNQISILTNFLKEKSNDAKFAKKIDNLNKAVEILTTVSRIDDDDEINDIKSTIIALCIINTVYKEEKQKWELVEKKAFEWMREKSQNIWKNDILEIIDSFSNPTKKSPLSLREKLQEKIAPNTNSTIENQNNDNTEKKVLMNLGKYEVILVKKE